MSMDVCFDEVAEKLGIDPIAIRLKNAVLPNEVVPFQSNGHEHGLSESIVMAAEKANWKKKKGKLPPKRGIGIGSGNMQSMFYMGFRSGSTAFIKFNDDGSCTVFTGTAIWVRATGPCTRRSCRK